MRRRGMGPLALGLWVVLSGHPVMPAQAVAQQGFAEVVEAARRAWAAQDPAGVVGQGGRVLLQLPGTESRSAVGREQAVRLLEGFVRRAEEVEVRVVSFREVGQGQGYAELLRLYRVRGTSETQRQRVLLAFRRSPDGGRWGLVELRVLDGGG
jgi:hypothetical protein